MPTLNFIGKEKVSTYNPPFHILDKKYNFGGSTENKIIHGDNLLALKSLLPEFEGKIKCIYIDPPYNTGNENWIYNDNVNAPQIKKWLGQVVGKEGEDLTRHDKWLCMMYPRLKLLKKLLADDGAIFISIDDNEQANLKLLCDEIFGVNNFVTQFVLKSKQGKGGTTSIISNEHEYIICYAKNFSDLKFKMIETENEGRKENLRQWGQADRREDRPTMFYPIKIDGKEIFPIKDDGTEGRWRVSEKTAQELLQNNFLEAVEKNKIWNIYRKFPPGKTFMPYGSWLSDKIGITAKGTILIKNFGINFSYPKPVKLIEHILKLCTEKNSIILDSFAGSGTTAHAVLNLNKSDGGERKFILVEMEDYAEKITAERVRRVGGSFDFYEIGEKIFDDEGNLNENLDDEKIFEYIWFTETGKRFEKISSENKFYLGEYEGAGIYFNYEKNSRTYLDWDFLATIKIRAENYVIYADECLLSEEQLSKYKIIFKKIPRDIKKI